MKRLLVALLLLAGGCEEPKPHYGPKAGPCRDMTTKNFLGNECFWPEQTLTHEHGQWVCRCPRKAAP